MMYKQLLSRLALRANIAARGDLAPRAKRPARAVRSTSKTPALVPALAAVALMTLPMRMAHAEQVDELVPRTGAFATRVETSKCDGAADTIGKYGGRALNALTKINPIRVVVDFARAGGDPKKYADEFKKDWDSAKGLAGDTAGFILKYAPGGLFSASLFHLSKLLPDGKVKDFMARSHQQITSMGRGIAEGAFDTLENDLKEIASDAWKVIKNIDDPEEFFTELGSMTQKWNATGSLSLIFTEDDPVEGLKKAAGNISRQIEVATTYFGVSGAGGQILAKAKLLKAGKGLSALKGVDIQKVTAKLIVKKIMTNNAIRELGDVGKKLIDGAPSSDKAAITAVIASLLSELEKSEQANEQPLHPLFRDTILKEVDVVWLGDDHAKGKSDPTHQMSLLHPKVETDSDCINLGDRILGKRGYPAKMLALCGNDNAAIEKGKHVWWERPVDFVPVWNDSCSGGSWNRSIWAPKCPTGFVAVGFALGGEGSTKPLPNRIACLKDDPAMVLHTDGASAGLKWVTNDQGSGAKIDVTIFERESGGLPLLWAVTGYPSGDAKYLAALDVPVIRQDICTTKKCVQHRTNDDIIRIRNLKRAKDQAAKASEAAERVEIARQQIETAKSYQSVVPRPGVDPAVLAAALEQTERLLLSQMWGAAKTFAPEEAWLKTIHGTYYHQPITDKSHSGRIEVKDGKITWTDGAGNVRHLQWRRDPRGKSSRIDLVDVERNTGNPPIFVEVIDSKIVNGNITGGRVVGFWIGWQEVFYLRQHQ